MDRPIIFSAPEVRALLEGRKTQVRRALKPASASENWPRVMWPQYVNGVRVGQTSSGPEMVDLPAADGGVIWAGPTAYAPGDRLWVRETITRFDKGSCDQWVWYSAGGNADASASWRWVKNKHPELTGDEHWPHPEGPAGGAPYTVPSIHMPRWASRLTLTVTDVRVQRLREITSADAISEGFRPHANSQTIDCDTPDPRNEFSDLWDSHAKPGFRWADDPWVAAVSFTTERRNIDDGEAGDG